jgi:hypothetical protein
MTETMDAVRHLHDDSHDSWMPINLNSLPEEPPVQPTLGRLGEIGLVYPGKRHVFSGPQESAKTLAAYAIGIQVIRDGNIIILIDFEMGGHDARARLRDLGATRDDIDMLRYLEPEQPATEQRLQALLQHDPSLVIIDAAIGAYDLQGLDDEKRKDAEKLARIYIKTFWKAGVATIFIDHVVKDTKTRGKYSIGSERKTGGADVHLGFEVVSPISRGTTGIYRIVTHKDRGGYHKRGTLADMHLTSHPETHAITWELQAAEHIAPGETWMPTKLMQKISGILEQKPEPVSRKTVIDEVGGRPEFARKAIDHLVRLQYATESPGARNAKLLHHTRTFTVLEWEKEHEDSPSPTRSHIVPGSGHSPSPTTLPPSGGAGLGDTHPDTPHGPDEQTAWSWLDDLQPEPPTEP